MSAFLAFLRLNWKPIAIGLLALAAWFALRHYGDVRYAAGYQQAVSENEKALAAWKVKYDERVKADEKRITDARIAHEQELAQLAAIHARPRPHLVCHDASHSRDMPAAARISESQASDAGILPREDAEGFDPAPAALDIASEADYLLANCRMLNQAVHGVLTGP